MTFDGATFDYERDNDRLQQQLGRVRNLMLDGQWRTLEQIERSTGDPTASISARLRDLRKKKFGAYCVSRRYDGNGLWSYRVSRDTPSTPPPRNEPVQVRPMKLSATWDCTRCGGSVMAPPPSLDPNYGMVTCPNCKGPTIARRRMA